MSSQPAAGTQANRGNLPKGACYKCGKTGHWSRDCTAPREEWIPQQPRDASAGTAADGAADPEGATGGSAAAGGATGKKKSNRPPKFTVVDHLLGPNGLAYLHGVIPEKFNQIAKGPGHEFGDFQRLMGLYREWTRKMYPYKPHEWVMNRVKVLCKTREARACIRELNERERIELGGEGVDAPEDFTEEDVFFPDQDQDQDNDDDEGEDVVFPDDDEEEEWNEAKHGKKAQLGVGGGVGKSKGAPAAADSDDDEEAIQSQREKDADAFDDARKEVGAGYFDESSDDDDDGIAVVGATRRKSAALGAERQKGKARKKLKEVAAKRRRKKKEPTPEPEDEEEAAEEGPEPPAEAAEASSPKRKQLRRRARDSDEEEEEEEEEEEAGASRRARRRVIKRGIDSDSDSDAPNLRDVLPNDVGGNVLGPSPAKPLVPSFLYDSESDGEKKGSEKKGSEKKGDE